MLTSMLYQCFQALKLYGKEPEAFGAVVSMFNLVLSDYSFDSIKSAFAFYLKYNSELPTPADIANIIERGNKPAFDRSVYISISKKQPEHRTSSEWQYIREYDSFMITGRN